MHRGEIKLNLGASFWGEAPKEVIALGLKSGINMKLNALGSAPPGGLAPVGDPWASTLNYPTGTRHLGSRMGPAPASKQLPCSQLSTGK